ncbi:hypothetical protein [Oceanobacillus salinisoli]|uniref:hypothetical protein n=1 Tax=Oceanobacillus salinisoli TaxID=2678611 RepID=UPI0012E2A75B|nr:hypothetical protein [Oceanobacillus salinisoli]
MNEKEIIAFNHLQNKVKQHERTIAQLVEIVAAMNRRIIDSPRKQKDMNQKELLIK